MGGVRAHHVHHRQQHGHQNHDGRQRFHEHADKQQEQNQDRPDQLNVVRQRENGFRRNRRYTCFDKQSTERGGGKQNQQHTACDPGRCAQRLHQGRKTQFTVNEQAHKQRVENGDDRRFGRREKARIDAAQNNQRRHQRPDASLHGFANFFLVPFLRQPLVATLAREQVVHHDQARGHHQARDDASHKQLRNGGRREGTKFFHCLLRCSQAQGRDTEDHHGNGWRNDDAKPARCSCHGRCVCTVITTLAHGGNHQHAHGGRCCRARARDRTKEQARQDGGKPQPTGDGPRKSFGNIHQSFGNSCSFHQGPGQHKGRQGHQGETAHRSKGDLNQRNRVLVQHQISSHRAATQRH